MVEQVSLNGIGAVCKKGNQVHKKLVQRCLVLGNRIIYRIGSSKVLTKVLSVEKCPLPHISSPPFTFSLLRIKSHNSCSAPDLEYYAAVTKPLGRCGHGPLGRCGQCQWQHARCGHPLNWEASLHLMLIVFVYPCLAVV